jgi:hypothetical protein
MLYVKQFTLNSNGNDFQAAENVLDFVVYNNGNAVVSLKTLSGGVITIQPDNFRSLGNPFYAQRRRKDSWSFGAGSNPSVEISWTTLENDC